MSGAPTRAVCRYLGGKWVLAPWINGYFPPLTDNRRQRDLWGALA